MRAGTPSPVADLARWLSACRRLLVLSGAGCSTESGIPDYRDLDGRWKRHPPMSFQRFVGCARERQRYWARSGVGWRRFSSSRPNAGHLALAALESAGLLSGLTQNVDGLHQQAGQRTVIDLHGRLDWAECLGCSIAYRREAFQHELLRLNPQLEDAVAAQAPDGDADLDDRAASEIQVPCCPAAGDS